MYIFYKLVCKLLKLITHWYLRSQAWNDIEIFTKEASWEKTTIDDDISWVM